MAEVNRWNTWIWMWASLVLAIMLRLLPLPQWAVWLRPDWVSLVCVFWIMVPPHRLGVVSAWAIGLLLDVISGSLLGEHALALALVAYLAQHYSLRFVTAPWWHQSLLIFGFVISEQLLVWMIQGMQGASVPMSLFWLPALTSMLFWPWLYWLLGEYCIGDFEL
jgi:rod shape-determining protein MreD